MLKGTILTVTHGDLRGYPRVTELKMARDMRLHEEESGEAHSRGETAEHKSQKSEASFVCHVQSALITRKNAICGCVLQAP